MEEKVPGDGGNILYNCRKARLDAYFRGTYDRTEAVPLGALSQPGENRGKERSIHEDAIKPSGERGTGEVGEAVDDAWKGYSCMFERGDNWREYLQIVKESWKRHASGD